MRHIPVKSPPFNVRAKDGNLVFAFGDVNTHAGEFVFEHNVEGTLAPHGLGPVAQVQSILNFRR